MEKLDSERVAKKYELELLRKTPIENIWIKELDELNDIL